MLEITPHILPPFAPIYTTNCRYILARGGRGGAKSYSIAQYFVVKTFDPEFKGLVLRQVLSTTDDSIKQQIEEVVRDMNIGHLFDFTAKEIRNTQTGTSIGIMAFQTKSSAHSARLKSITAFTHVWVEEFDEVKEADFDKLDASIRKPGVELKIIVSFNTPNVGHYIFGRWFNPDGTPRDMKDTLHIHTTYLDIPHVYLNKSFLAIVEKERLTNPEKYRHVYLGHWVLESAMQIYSGWKRMALFPVHLPFVYGLDFGYQDEWGLVKVASEKGHLYVEEMVYARNLVNTEIIEIIKGLPKATVIADSSEPRSIAELRKAGIRVIPARKGPDSVRHGINTVRQMQVMVSGESANLWNEYQHYEWADKRTGVPLDKMNHLLDPLRYSTTFLVRQIRERKYSVR